MLQIKDRHFLKKKVLNELKKRVTSLYSVNQSEIFSKQSRIEMVKTETNLILYFINDEATLIEDGSDVYPTLHAVLNKKIQLREVSVDKGAIKFITNGADVMVPGIVDVDESIQIGEIVGIVDDQYKKTLAIGRALMNANEIKTTKNGKAIKNLHHVRDKIWNTIEKLKS
ncbi:MAG: DUF1947 domain-containing protein [Candidatus Helarchaeota archaeon]